MILQEEAKRLSIFAYYDADGVVDDYVVYLLQQVKKHCAAQIIVVNGTLTPESEKKVKPHCTQLIYRVNEGFDVTGYKEAFLQVEDVTQYDEVLFYNQTIFGPVCSLSPMFEAMNKKDIDFWGLTHHKGAENASWGLGVTVAPHVQSFFFAVRKNMFASEDFTAYWNNLPPIVTYWDAVGKHEALFTPHFSELGYQWSTFMETAELEPYNDYHMMGMPTELLYLGCPFIKRKSFLCARHSYTNIPQGAATQMLFDMVREKTEYPISYLTQNLLRTADVATLTDALTLTFDVQRIRGKSAQTLAVIWFAQEALGEMLCKAAQKLQKDTAAICLFATQELHEKFAPQLLRNVPCFVTEKNGAEYLFGPLWKEVNAYENVLYLNNDMPLLLNEFYDATSLGVALESLTQKGCGALLEQRPELGVLTALNFAHQECLSLGLNWPQIAPSVAQAFADAEMRVPLGEQAPGVAVRGGMFFARVKAVQPLTKFAFADAHFEGLYPAWEFFAPIAAQSAGYLSATVGTEQQAFTALSNQTSLQRSAIQKWVTPTKHRIDEVIFRQQAILDFYQERRFQMTLDQAFKAKLTVKQKMWIVLQICVKPETFAKWHKTPAQPTEFPTDLLD